MGSSAAACALRIWAFAPLALNQAWMAACMVDVGITSTPDSRARRNVAYVDLLNVLPIEADGGRTVLPMLRRKAPA